jgi:hypothetical protein
VNVTITDEPPPPPTGGGAKTTGGGWLAGDAGGKINFGFHAEETASGLEGELQLNDKGSKVKIHVNDVTALGAGDCGADSIELEGAGTLNGVDATFRVCVDDNGEGAGAETGDRFYLECTARCAGGYDTGSHTADDGIDGGNVQVRQAAQPAAFVGTQPVAASEPRPATLLLDPLLLTDGVAGQAQLFTVVVYDQNQEELSNAAVTLERVRSDGLVETLSGVTGVAGTAVFTVVNLGVLTEYLATAGGAESNAIEVTALSG